MSFGTHSFSGSLLQHGERSIGPVDASKACEQALETEDALIEFPGLKTRTAESSQFAVQCPFNGQSI
jgi:hypothetical protein